MQLIKIPGNIKSEIIESLILQMGDILVALWQLYRVYTQELEHIQDIETGIGEGLGKICQFKHLPLVDEGSFIVATHIDSIKKT